MMNGNKGAKKEARKKDEPAIIAPNVLKKRRNHQKEVLYRRIMVDARVANGERLPISDDAGADTYGRSKELEEYLNFRGIKRVKISETES